MFERRNLTRGVSRPVLIGALAAFALTACKPAAPPSAASSASSEPPASAAPAPLAAVPLSDSAAPPLAPAPAASALPAAPPARVGRVSNPSDGYAFADRAFAMNQAFADAPPDYAFDYGAGERPWVWRGDDQSMRVAEPLPGGGERYYYYAPGANTPYLVRDPDYSYAYDQGQLVVVYDRNGHRRDPDKQAALIAGRLLARAIALNDASQRNQREAVAEANWAARHAAIEQQQQQWAAAQAADPGWRAYHDQHADASRSVWASERYRRAAEAARYDQQMNDAAQARRDWQAAQQARGWTKGGPPNPGPAPGGWGGQHPPGPPQPAGPRQPSPGPRPNGAPAWGPGPGSHQPGQGRGEHRRPGGPGPDRQQAVAAQQAQLQAQQRRNAQTQVQAARQAEARTKAEAKAVGTRGAEPIDQTGHRPQGARAPSANSGASTPNDHHRHREPNEPNAQ